MGYDIPIVMAVVRGASGFIRTRPTDDDAWPLMIVNAAGGAADRWFGMSDRGSKSDNEHLLRNAYRIPEVNPPIASDLIDHARLCARDLVELNRAAIERLAIELDRRSEIDGDEAARILGRVERPPYRQISWSRPAPAAPPRDLREGRTGAYFRATALPPRGDGLTRRVDGYFI